MAVNDSDNIKKIVSEARKSWKSVENTYRERALKMFPWLCGRCSREFTSKSLRELTVHHKDHNHDNNPPDGSNWELLCVYCHDNEHDRMGVADAYDNEPSGRSEKSDDGFAQNPFAGLADLLKEKENK